MKDQAGSEITVGCRVTEADDDFGDGTVESITVPVGAGAGFNVGILMWDKPENGGPGWSSDGGGRGAEHLLVVAAAEDTERPEKEYTDEEIKAARFKERFGQSPTQSHRSACHHKRLLALRGVSEQAAS